MLTFMATVAAEGLWGVTTILVWQIDDAGPWDSLPGLMWFVAFITGILCLLLMPLVYRFRREPPPTPIAALSLVAGLIPLLIGIVRSMS
jgi:hypothetical protein